MKESTQAIIDAIDRNTNAIEHLLEAIAGRKKIGQPPSINSPLSDWVDLHGFFMVIKAHGLIGYRTREGAAAFVDWLMGSDESILKICRGYVGGIVDTLENIQMSRQVLKESGFADGKIQTPNDLAYLFKSGAIYRLRLFHVGVATINEFRKALEMFGHLKY